MKQKKAQTSPLFVSVIVFWFTLFTISGLISYSLISSGDISFWHQYNGADGTEPALWDYIGLFVGIMSFQVADVPLPITIFLQQLGVFTLWIIVNLIRGTDG